MKKSIEIGMKVGRNGRLARQVKEGKLNNKFVNEIMAATPNDIKDIVEFLTADNNELLDTEIYALFELSKNWDYSAKEATALRGLAKAIYDVTFNRFAMTNDTETVYEVMKAAFNQTDFVSDEELDYYADLMENGNEEEQLKKEVEEIIQHNDFMDENLEKIDELGRGDLRQIVDRILAKGGGLRDENMVSLYESAEEYPDYADTLKAIAKMFFDAQFKFFENDNDIQTVWEVVSNLHEKTDLIDDEKYNYWKHEHQLFA